MNILHLNSFDHGGAAKAAYGIHRAMKEIGTNSVLFTLAKYTHEMPDSLCLYENDFFIKLEERFQDFERSRLENREKYYLNRSGSFLTPNARGIISSLERINFKPTVLVLHWVSRFLSAKVIRELSTYYAAPVFWNVLDMAPLTGGCHYAWDCSGYQSSCGNCPALGSENKLDLSHKQLQRKIEEFKGISLHAIAGSEMDRKVIKSSALFRNRDVEKIYLAPDPQFFSPKSKIEARAALELPQNRRIMLFPSYKFQNKRKGSQLLSEALSSDFFKTRNRNENPVLLSIGDGNEIESQVEANFEIKKLGFVANQNILARAYCASDFLVSPSVQDSGPLMIFESIACGTPVVAFEIGVAPDLVVSGKTGYLAKTGSIEDLQIGMQTLLNCSQENLTKIQDLCKEFGQKHLTPEIQAKAFLTFIHASIS